MLVIPCFPFIPQLAQSKGNLPSPSLINEYSRKLLEEEGFYCSAPVNGPEDSPCHYQVCYGGRKALQVCLVVWGFLGVFFVLLGFGWLAF